MREHNIIQIPWRPFSFGLFLLLSMLGLSLPAHAGLGDTAADSIEKDRAAMRGTLNSTTTANYTTHEIKAENGVTVHEYVSPSGTVFAVTAYGQTLPNLTQLLGSYVGRLSEAPQNRQARRRPLTIEEPDFILQVSGRMRAFRVVAYLPNQLPPKMAPEEIQ